jgi:hypothetical protein
VKNWVQKQTRASIKKLTNFLGPLGVISNLKIKIKNWNWDPRFS